MASVVKEKNEKFYTWKRYLKMCANPEKEKLPKHITEIGTGFHTMKEIVAYSKTLPKNPILRNYVEDRIEKERKQSEVDDYEQEYSNAPGCI